MAWLHFSRTARNLALSAASTWYLAAVDVVLSLRWWWGADERGKRWGGDVFQSYLITFISHSFHGCKRFYDPYF